MAELACRVRGVFLSMSEQGAAAPTVLLEIPSGDCIPIYIGLWEAISIRNAIKGEVLPRPITHDLFVEVLKRFNATVTALSIDSLEDGIFYAKLHVHCRAGATAKYLGVTAPSPTTEKDTAVSPSRPAHAAGR